MKNACKPNVAKCKLSPMPGALKPCCLMLLALLWKNTAFKVMVHSEQFPMGPNGSWERNSRTTVWSHWGKIYCIFGSLNFRTALMSCSISWSYAHFFLVKNKKAEIWIFSELKPRPKSICKKDNSWEMSGLCEFRPATHAVNLSQTGKETMLAKSFLDFCRVLITAGEQVNFSDPSLTTPRPKGWVVPIKGEGAPLRQGLWITWELNQWDETEFYGRGKPWPVRPIEQDSCRPAIL